MSPRGYRQKKPLQLLKPTARETPSRPADTAGRSPRGAPPSANVPHRRTSPSAGLLLLFHPPPVFIKERGRLEAAPIPFSKPLRHASRFWFACLLPPRSCQLIGGSRADLPSRNAPSRRRIGFFCFYLVIFGQDDKTRPSVATTKGGLVAVKMGKDGESAKLKEEKESKDEIHMKVKSKGEPSGEEDGKEEVEVEIEAKFVEKEEVTGSGDGAGGKGTKKKDTKEKDKKKKEGGDDSGKAEEDNKGKAKDSEGKGQVKKEKKDGAGDDGGEEKGKEKKDKKDKGEKNDKEKKEKKKDKGGEKKKDKGTKEKTTDPVKLRAKLEKVDTKLQDLHAKREDILRQLKELELEEGGKGKANEEKPAHVQNLEQGGENVVKEQSHVAAA